MTKVTIGFPVYNEARYVARVLDNILEQTHQEFVVVLSDNCSTDGTTEICESYAALDRRIRFYRENENRGSLYNFRKVLDLAEGEFFCWVSGHDIRSLTFLEQCVDALNTEPGVVLTYPQAIWLEEDDTEGERIAGLPDLRDCSRWARFQLVLWELGYAYPFYGMYRLSALRKVIIPDSPLAPDVILLSELALVGEFSQIRQQLLQMRRLKGAGNPVRYLEKTTGHHNTLAQCLKVVGSLTTRWCHSVFRQCRSRRGKVFALVSIVLAVVFGYGPLIREFVSEHWRGGGKA